VKTAVDTDVGDLVGEGPEIGEAMRDPAAHSLRDLIDDLAHRGLVWSSRVFVPLYGPTWTGTASQQ
jgi:hypothetical protein